MDVLVEHGEALQQAVFFATASLLNLEVDLLFLDTTSVYVEIEAEDDDGLRRFGHSRDHRPDLPQVVVALAVTRADRCRATRPMPASSRMCSDLAG